MEFEYKSDELSKINAEAYRKVSRWAISLHINHHIGIQLECHDEVVLKYRFPRDAGREYHGDGCGSGLGIFNFLLFLVYLLALIQDAMIDVVTNIMINGQNVAQLQANSNVEEMRREF